MGILGMKFVFNRQVEALLTIFALSIFADKRVLSSEISALIKSAEDIDSRVNSSLPVTEAKLLMWFETNRMRLEDKLRLGPIGFKRWFESVMSDLSDFSDQALLTDLLHRTSLADGELHVSEKALRILVESKFQQRPELP